MQNRSRIPLKGRLIFLDHIRYLAMYAGILFHGALAYLSFPAPDWFFWQGSGSLIFDYAIWITHRTRMPIFFVISGALAAQSLYSNGEKLFFVKKVRHIFVPFLVGLITIVPIMLRLHQASAQATCRKMIGIFCGDTLFVPFQLGDLAFIQPAHLWFIYYLFIFYILHLLINKILKQSKVPIPLVKNILYLFIFLSLLSMENCGAINKTSSFRIDVPAFIFYFSFYLLGTMMKLSQVSITNINIKYVFLITLILGIVIPLLLFRENALPQSVFYFYISIMALLNLIFSIAFIDVIFHFSKKLLMADNSWVRWNIRASYWIYRWHIIPIVLLQGILFYSGTSIFVKYLMVVILSTLILLICFCLRDKITHHIIRRARSMLAGNSSEN